MQLKRIRTEKGYTVPELSRQSGVPIRTIEDIEKKHNCTIVNAKKLAKILCVTLDELCADE